MTIEISLTVQDEALRKALADPELVAGPVTDFLRRAGFTVERKAKELAPVDTGRLRSSIESRAEPPRAIIGTLVTYAPMVELGTKPHIIVPRYKKALAFNIGGDRVIVRKVNPPGTRPKPFLRPALEQSRAAIARLLEQAKAQIARRWERG